jgi:hypothetical protein
MDENFGLLRAINDTDDCLHIFMLQASKSLAGYESTKVSDTVTFTLITSKVEPALDRNAFTQF